VGAAVDVRAVVDLTQVDPPSQQPVHRAPRPHARAGRGGQAALGQHPAQLADTRPIGAALEEFGNQRPITGIGVQTPVVSTAIPDRRRADLHAARDRPLLCRTPCRAHPIKLPLTERQHEAQYQLAGVR
jgi:hypothetical protein